MKHKTFLAGLIAGGTLFTVGLMLGGAGNARGYGHGPSNGPAYHGGTATFDSITARRFELVDRYGNTKIEMRASDDGGAFTIYDTNGDRRVKLTGEGAVTVFDKQGRARVRMTAQGNLHTPHLRGGQVLAYNRAGQISGKLVERSAHAYR